MNKFEKHIQSNIYTMTDRAIVLQITKKPDWTLQDILDALPSYHSQNSLRNYLTKFFTKEEIKKHTTTDEHVEETSVEQTSQTVEKTPTPKTANSIDKAANVLWSKEEVSMLKTFFPVFGTTEYMSAILYIANSTPPQCRSKSSIISKANANHLYRIRHASIQDVKDIKLLRSREKNITDALQAIMQHDVTGVNTLSSIFSQLSKQYCIADIIAITKNTQHIHVQEEQTMKQTTSDISREELFAAIRKLAEDPDVSISVNIDFGDGCMFIWPPASKKNGGDRA